MQFSKLAFVAALTALALAQGPVSIADLPQCAVSAALNAIGATSCSSPDIPTEITCACKDAAFIKTLQDQLPSVCDAAQIAKAIQVATQLCAQFGVTLVLPGTSTTSPVSSTPATTTSPTTVAVTTSTSSTSTAPIVTTPAPTYNGTATRTATSSVSQFTGAAEQVKGSWAAAGIIGVGALLMGL